jgi:hypothetical protein
MKLDVVRTQFGKDATNGMLFINGLFECFTLEDEYRDVKVAGETCIPDGEYEIKLRTVGGFHEKYTKRYGALHKGMLWLQDVPNFKWILIHTGNTDEHTAGCLLLGETQQDLDKGKDGFVGGSGDAYKKMYPKVAKELLLGNKVTIKYSKINLGGVSNASPPDMVNATTINEKLSEINGNLINLNAKLEGKNIV